MGETQDKFAELLLTTAQVGRILNLCINDVRELIRSGELPGVHRPVPRNRRRKAGRPRFFVRRSDLEAYIANLEPVAASKEIYRPQRTAKPKTSRRASSLDVEQFV